MFSEHKNYGISVSRGIKAIPNEAVKWRLQSPDGTFFGDVSWGAYQAISEGTLDKYTPASTKESNILSEFRKHPGIELKSQDGKLFGKVSYNAYMAIEGNTLGSYKPVNEDESKALDAFKSELLIPLELTFEDAKDKASAEAATRPLGAVEAAAEKAGIKLKKEEKKDQKVRTETKKFGNISYNAYQAIVSGNLDKYTPESEEEAKILQEYEKAAGQYLYDGEWYDVPEEWAGSYTDGKTYFDIAGYAVDKSIHGAWDFAEDAVDFAYGGLEWLLSKFTWGDTSKWLENRAHWNFSRTTNAERSSLKLEAEYNIPDWVREYVGPTAEGAGRLIIPIIAEVATYGASPLLEGSLASQPLAVGASAGTKATLGAVAKNVVSNAAKVKPSTALFWAGAAGSYTKDAYALSGDAGKALLYGTVMGTAEVATEKIFGGFGGTDIGGNIISFGGKEGLVNFNIKNGFLRKLVSMGAEGAEEMIMTGVEPVGKRLTGIDKNAAGPGVEDVLSSGVQGVLLSALMGASTYPVQQYQRSQNIKILNIATEGINAMFAQESSKRLPLSTKATDAEIIARQKEIKKFTQSYVELVQDVIFPTQGDFFVDIHTGKAIEIVSRDDKNTVVKIGDKDNIDTKTYSNDDIDKLAMGGRYSKVRPEVIDELRSILNEEVKQKSAEVKKEAKSSSESRAVFTGELDEIADTQMPSVAVGEEFKDKKTGDVIRIVSRDGENTIIERDSGKTVERKTFSNKQADMLKVNDRYEQVTSGESVSSVAKKSQPAFSNPKDAQKYNVLISNLKRVATELGILDTQFYDTLQSIDLHNLSVEDIALINSEFQRIFDGVEKTALVKSWLDGIQSALEDVSGINFENMHDTDESEASQYEIMERLGLTYDEQNAIMEYKSSGSYVLNEKLYQNKELTVEEKSFVHNINSALDKFPVYKGKTYRNMSFDFKGKKAMDDFVSQHTVGKTVTYASFTSSSKSSDGYITDGDLLVHIEIDGIEGRDVGDIGITEEFEVLFKSGTVFKVKDLSYNGKEVNIILVEMINSGKSNDSGLLPRIAETENHGENQDSYGIGNRETEISGENRKVSQESSFVRERSAADNGISENQSNGSTGNHREGSGRNNSRYDTGIGNDSNAERQTLSEINSNEISISNDVNTAKIVEAIEETLLPGARERILKITKEKTGEASISAFAKTMKEVYEITGTIRKMTEWFSDGGKKVVSVLENITESDSVTQMWFFPPSETDLSADISEVSSEKKKETSVSAKNNDETQKEPEEVYINQNTGDTYRIIKRNERNAIVEVTENGKTTEFVMTNAQVEKIVSDTQNVRIEAATSAESGNTTGIEESIADNNAENSTDAQLIQDYNETVDNILTVSDETAKELADKRVAVEVSKNTPAVILDNVEDAKDLKVIINYNKLYLAVRKGGVFKGHYHNLGAKIAKKLPDFLSNPDAIIQLDNGRLNLLATVETERGSNGIISVELNSTKDIEGKYEDYNVVVTMFSSDDNYVQNLISGKDVAVKYKREDLSQVNPQLYKWLAIINDKSSVNNIVTQEKNVVKDSIRNESENDASNTYDVSTDKVRYSFDSDSDLQSNSDSGIMGAETRGENNGNIGEYDAGREDVLRKNEEDRLHGRTNQEKHSQNQGNTSGRKGRALPVDGGEYGSNVPRQGKIRNVFHGTPYRFKSFLKSYVDMGIHFGSEAQAKERLSSNEGYITEFDLELKNPLVTEDIFGERSPEQYVDELIKKSRLNTGEKQALKKRFDEYCDSDISAEAKKSLKSKLQTGDYQLMTEISDDGICVGIEIADDNSNVNTVPMLNLIDKNQLMDIVGFDSTAELLIKKVVPEGLKEALVPHILEQAVPFEEQYLKLRKIEEILQSFGYDGFAYQNDNEGDGWSYAVFDDSQIIRAEDSIEESGETNDTPGNNTRRTGRVSEGTGNQGRRDSSDTGNVSHGTTAVDTEGFNRVKNQERNALEGGSEKYLVTTIYGTESENDSNRSETDGRRFIEAVKKGGEEYGSKDTKTLEGQRTGKNNDSVWERSDDSEGVYRSLGGGEKTLRAGESDGRGHIDWSGRIQSYNLNTPREKELAYGLLREISEKRIKGVDSLGRTVGKPVQDYFSNTVLKTEDSALIPLYHATDNEFNVFELGDFGYHVGNAEQAMYLDKKYIKEVYANITKPLIVNGDTMRWPGLVVANKALEQNIISIAEYETVSKLKGFLRNDANSEANKAIKELLKSKGYDGLVYPNGHEGEGLSAIAFDSEQLKYVSNENPTISKDLRYSIEGENINEQTGNILSDDGGKRKDGTSARKPVKTMDGRTSRYRERRSTAYQRRKLCQALRDAGNTETKVVHGHKCEVIPTEHYDKRMQTLVDKNKADGYDETILITGQATLPFVKDKNGKPKTARGVFIETTSGKRIAIVQYDHEHYMPEQINDHEKVHKNYKSNRTQKVKNLILNSLSIREKKDVLERLSKDYNGVIQGNEDAIFEEFVANVLSGMNEYTMQFNDVVKAYWAGDDATIDSFKASEYAESIDAGGINADVLDDVGFGNENEISESGELNGYEQNSASRKLGRVENSSKTKRHNPMGEVGQLQSKESNTPNTKRVYRSGVSAETITSSGLTAEQATIKIQNKLEGLATEFYREAKKGDKSKTDIFVTENTIYYPDNVFERDYVSVRNGVASFTEKRFNDLIDEFSVPVGGQLNQNYAKGYVTYISPSDFLSLTTNNETAIIKQTKTTPDIYGNGKLDVKRLAATRQTPFLEIDFDDGVVYGHEGRHRMVMLRDAGVDKVAIVVKSLNPEADKHNTKKMENVFVTGQVINGKKTLGKVTLDEIIPLSPKYRNEVKEKFVENIANVQYSLDTLEKDATVLTSERKKQILEQWEKNRVGHEDKTTKEQLADWGNKQKEAWGERAAWIAHNMSRVFPNIPERGEKGTFFAEFRKNMIQWKSLPTTASFMVQDKLNQMTEGLTPEEFKTFSELVYFLDLQEEAQIQKEKGYTEILLPNEITPREVDEIVKILNEEASSKVKKALKKRSEIWNELKQQYIDLNRYIGFDTDGKFKRKNYYHHQVIEYMNGGGKGTGSRNLGIKAGRGWLKERHGSTEAINTDFLAVEYKAMLQMQYDVYVANMLGKIKEQYDIKPQLEKQAFQNNKKLLNEIINKEASDGEGGIRLNSKGKPDSETYRQQQWYNQRIMFGFSSLFDLAKDGALPTFDGEYTQVVNALSEARLNVTGLYNYVGVLAGTELPEGAPDAMEQAQISARTVMKYTSQKKAWIRETLGENYQTWETLAEDMSDTHSIHQPRRGNYFYTKTTVDEDAFNKAFNEMAFSLAAGEGVETNAEVKKLFEQYSDTIRLVGAAYEQWVIPNEIVSVMDEVANPKQINIVNQLSRSVLSTWKGWATSVNPLRTVKFGIRNLFGDLDAVIAGNPKIVTYSKQAVEEIYQAMRHKKYSDVFMEWVERGGYSSMIFANEMDAKMQDKLFKHLKDKKGTEIFKILKKPFEGYYNSVETAHNFREAILRYSAYLYYKDAISKNGGNVKDYVASNRYIVRGLNTVEDKAYQLSKDLLGAYDEVGRMGQALRRHLIPFYSFTETNFKRYYRMFENAVASEGNIPTKAVNVLRRTFMINLLGLLMAAWNRLVQDENDDKLPPTARNVPHLTLGRIGDDIYAFRQLGSFAEILEWFGFEDYEFTKEDFLAPVDKIWGMITPAVKLPVELVSGLNFYPSLSEPRAIRDRWQHFFSSYGVADVYDAVMGKPTRGIGDAAKGGFLYSYNYKESAYYEILDIKRNYQGSNEGTIYKPDDKSNALYYMKTAIRYKDKDAAVKYLDEYFENGGTVKGIRQSFAMLNPMYGYTSKDNIEKGEAFVASLTPEEQDKLKIAQEFYEEDLMLPEKVLTALGKKDITDEEAKNVLGNYIKAMCK